MSTLAVGTSSAPIDAEVARSLIAQSFAANAGELLEWYRARFMLDDDPDMADDYAAAGKMQRVDDPADFVLYAPDEVEEPWTGKLRDLFDPANWTFDYEDDGKLEFYSQTDGELRVVVEVDGPKYTIDLEAD